ncbi:hypothetical protein HMPREF1531_01506 [Propionibacterium sp. oral taxon 192 str. F0372]|nr:hypothetical protein HMPREF1531_01506 [Propionibacterium sp. oral taxon 192 str. F0372]
MPDSYGERVPRILVVDDDDTVRGVVGDYLRAAGMEVVTRNDGVDAFATASTQRFDLIVLDLMLPGIDGLEVHRRLCRCGIRTPVIMLTAKASEADRVLGLETGADDYLTKPFSARELVLRVQSILRRSGASETHESERQIVVDGDIRLDLTARKAFRDEAQLDLTLREYDLLAHFVTHPDEVMSREELMGHVWGWEYGDPSTVTVHVRRVRSKIEADPANPKRLVTVWGRGYRWEPAEE